MRTKKVEEILSYYGGYWRLNMIDFAYLANPYFPTEEMLDEIKSNIKPLMKNYPSGSKNISSLLSRLLYVDPERVLVGNGASEIIRFMNKLFVKKITIPIPTFNEYENTLVGEEINYFRRNLDFSLDIDGFVRSVKDSQSNAALLINPNNPTGQFVNVGDLRYILEKLCDLDIFILDESFIHFASSQKISTMIEFIEDYGNLAIIQSMSKAYGIPGLRLGYIVTKNKTMLERLRLALPIWNVNSIAEFFLELLVKYEAEYQRSRKKVIETTRELFKNLSTISYLHAYPTKANFVFARIKNGLTSTQLRDILFERSKMLIKDCSNKTGLNNKFVRIASRTKKENDDLVIALRKLACINRM